MVREGGHAIVVSHECKIVDPSVLIRTRSQPFPTGTNLVTALGIQDSKTATRLRTAVLEAVRERKTSTLRWRVREGTLGNLVTVQPASEPGLALVSITELDKSLGPIAPELLMEIFDFTRAEAEIAALLFSGLDLADIAAKRRVEVATVRGQVKPLLHKTGVASQRHLILVLSRIAAVSSQIKTHSDEAEARSRFALAS